MGVQHEGGGALRTALGTLDDHALVARPECLQAVLSPA